MLFVQVLKLKVSLPLCWHCSDICPTTANNLPTLSSECFWSQTLPREGRSISNSENKSFVDSRSGGSLVRWAGTSPTSSTGPTSQPATSSWWTTSTTSTPNGESPGKPSSICLDRFAAKYKSRNDNLLISGSIRWASDRWLRQAAVVHIHLCLVQPGAPHGRLQVLRRLRNPGLPQPGGVHGVHLFAPSPGLCTVTDVFNCSPFYAGYSWGVWSALQRRHHLPDQHGSWDPWPDLGGAAQGLCWRWQGREQGGDRQATSRGHAQVASLLFVLTFIFIFLRKLPDDYSPHEVKEAIEVLGGMQPMNIFLRSSCLLVQSWKPIYVLFPDKRLTGCKGCWAFCAAPWPTWWWRLRERSSWATTSKKFSTTCLMQRWKTPQIF